MNDTGLSLPPAYRLVCLDSVSSTNDEARRLAEAGADDGTLVWAQSQTQGRGRYGRNWTSPQGNLFLSLVLRPDCTLQQAGQLGFVAALGLGEAIGRVAPPMIEVTYKWPNDVLLNGRKGAGILLESKASPEAELEWLVLGIGANVTSYPDDARTPATALHVEGCATSVTPGDLLSAFSRPFLVWVNRWLEDGFAPVRAAWLNHAAGLGKEIEVRLPKETVTGVFADLDADGALLLELVDGRRRTITAGDVHFAA